MGRIIRKGAAVDDILDDVRTTHTRALAHGGIAAKLSTEKLAPTIAIVDTVEVKIETLEIEVGMLSAALDVEGSKSDKFLGKISDDAWNAVGRPASDPYFSLLFPGGIAFYTQGDVAGQPSRMRLLASLFEEHVHPKVPDEMADAAAEAIKAQATALEARVTPLFVLETAQERASLAPRRLPSGRRLFVFGKTQSAERET